ncbi:transmembrane protein, putative (macronuclear) [Tetrahymena thermophila SB210]|uniref:Transmembrane protein, putative n=1 Tax=Tetrahymena thermophila (strain SB210) TaxID=312017 RepID=W7X310_TETTS|nr:transmembrane protein, putative [Tetrahymena thermophila SB210]EWS73705.1 transmembrane protein, putative [Tetrahymena thermophila SB210]|eukprot:XP_012653743.1 transmembrane protein, putative [Tetrahymena thermophila SB210]
MLLLNNYLEKGNNCSPLLFPHIKIQLVLKSFISFHMRQVTIESSLHHTICNIQSSTEIILFFFLPYFFVVFITKIQKQHDFLYTTYCNQPNILIKFLFINQFVIKSTLNLIFFNQFRFTDILCIIVISFQIRLVRQIDDYCIFLYNNFYSSDPLFKSNKLTHIYILTPKSFIYSFQVCYVKNQLFLSQATAYLYFFKKSN